MENVILYKFIYLARVVWLRIFSSNVTDQANRAWDGMTWPTPITSPVINEREAVSRSMSGQLLYDHPNNYFTSHQKLLFGKVKHMRRYPERRYATVRGRKIDS